MISILVKRVVAILGLCLCLGLINWKIAEKEEHLANGQTVLLELAPVDPRSLMQGDFMALRYALQRSILDKVPGDLLKERIGIDGVAWVELTENNVAKLHTVTVNGNASETPAAGSSTPGLVALQFRVRQRDVRLGTDAFFFQEGTGPAYEAARFGKFRVNKDGEMLLTDLLDEKLAAIKAPSQ